MKNLEKQVEKHLDLAQNCNLKYFKTEQDALTFAMNCIDLTTLMGIDTKTKVEALCRKARQDYHPSPAAVCIFPAFVRCAKEVLKGTKTKVATVVGGFPYGVLPDHLKKQEVKYALDEGADELDMVFSRGEFLARNYEEVGNDILNTRGICEGKTLKVILETGELETIENIAKASALAIRHGADFLKTSTGKIAVNATPTAFATMALMIKDNYEETGTRVGIKAAGGISDIPTTLLYIKLLENILGEGWLSPRYFRIGTSRLGDILLERNETEQK